MKLAFLIALAAVLLVPLASAEAMPCPPEGKFQCPDIGCTQGMQNAGDTAANAPRTACLTAAPVVGLVLQTGLSTAGAVVCDLTCPPSEPGGNPGGHSPIGDVVENVKDVTFHKLHENLG